MTLQPNTQRLLSLDFMRGLIMVLLMMGGTRMYKNLFELSEGSGVHLCASTPLRFKFYRKVSNAFTMELKTAPTSRG